MKMKKDDLKEVIAENGFLEHYKSSMLKADMQILALKSIGLAANEPMPTTRSTPFKTPAKVANTPGYSSPKTESPRVAAVADAAPPSTATRKSRRVAMKQGLIEADEALPTSDEEEEKVQADDSQEEDESSEGGEEEPQTTGWSDSPSAFWNAVDYVAAYWAFAVVILFIAVVIGYVVLESPMKDSIQTQWETFRTMVLEKLEEVKKSRSL